MEITREMRIAVHREYMAEEEGKDIKDTEGPRNWAVRKLIETRAALADAVQKLKDAGVEI